jgi:hypothetical protein
MRLGKELGHISDENGSRILLKKQSKLAEIVHSHLLSSKKFNGTCDARKEGQVRFRQVRFCSRFWQT